MNYFTKKRLAIWAIIILLIVNISAIGTIIMHRYYVNPDYYRCLPPRSMMMDCKLNKPGLKHHKKKEFIHRICMNIDFNEEQMKEIKEFKTIYHLKSKPIFVEMDSLRKLMMYEIRKDDSDTVVLNNISNELGRLHSQLKRNTFNYFLKLKGICSNEQLVQLDSLMVDMIERRPLHHRKFKDRVGPRCKIKQKCIDE